MIARHDHCKGLNLHSGALATFLGLGVTTPQRVWDGGIVFLSMGCLVSVALQLFPCGAEGLRTPGIDLDVVDRGIILRSMDRGWRALGDVARLVKVELEGLDRRLLGRSGGPRGEALEKGQVTRPVQARLEKNTIVHITLNKLILSFLYR